MNFSILFGKWAIKAHADAHHFYDGYLPYEFHLRMTVSNAMKYMELNLDKGYIEGPEGSRPFDYNKEKYDAHLLNQVILCGCWGHDLIEDVRKNYADIKESITKILLENIQVWDASGIGNVAEQVANIIFAVTNEKGKNRKERESQKYFDGIKATPYATYVKLCDRLANIQYSSMTQELSDGKLKMYRKEYAHFKEQLFDPKYVVMFAEMEKIIVEPFKATAPPKVNPVIPAGLMGCKTYDPKIICGKCQHYAEPVKKNIFFTDERGLRIHRQTDHCAKCDTGEKYCEMVMGDPQAEREVKETLKTCNTSWQDTENPDLKKNS